MNEEKHTGNLIAGSHLSTDAQVHWDGSFVVIESGFSTIISLVRAAFVQSGNWPVKAALRLYRTSLPMFPSTLRAQRVQIREVSIPCEGLAFDPTSLFSCLQTSTCMNLASLVSQLPLLVSRCQGSTSTQTHSVKWDGCLTLDEQQFLSLLNWLYSPRFKSETRREATTAVRRTQQVVLRVIRTSSPQAACTDIREATRAWVYNYQPIRTIERSMYSKRILFQDGKSGNEERIMHMEDAKRILREMRFVPVEGEMPLDWGAQHRPLAGQSAKEEEGKQS